MMTFASENVPELCTTVIFFFELLNNSDLKSFFLPSKCQVAYLAYAEVK